MKEQVTQYKHLIVCLVMGFLIGVVLFSLNNGYNLTSGKVVIYSIFFSLVFTVIIVVTIVGIAYVYYFLTEYKMIGKSKDFLENYINKDENVIQDLFNIIGDSMIWHNEHNKFSGIIIRKDFKLEDEMKKEEKQGSNYVKVTDIINKEYLSREKSNIKGKLKVSDKQYKELRRKFHYWFGNLLDRYERGYYTDYLNNKNTRWDFRYVKAKVLNKDIDRETGLVEVVVEYKNEKYKINKQQNGFQEENIQVERYEDIPLGRYVQVGVIVEYFFNGDIKNVAPKAILL